MNGTDWQLGIFAKQPEPGRVKTRLAQETSPVWAAALAEAMLRDTLKCMKRVAVGRRMLAYAPDEALLYFRGLAESRLEITAQGPGELGERMQRYFSQHLGACARVVIVGADSPTLPIQYVQRAFELLEDSDVVLGPATDGGYYLIGCKDAVPPIFHGIPWGSCSVLSQTVLRLKEARLACALLPPWYDIDTLADVHMLHGHLQAMRAAGVDPQIPETEKLLSA